VNGEENACGLNIKENYRRINFGQKFSLPLFSEEDVGVEDEHRVS
jgi:hypothetical protein